MQGKVFSVLKEQLHLHADIVVVLLSYRYSKSLSLQAELAPLYSLLSSGNLLYITWWDAGASSRNNEASYNPHLFQREYYILLTVLLTTCNTTLRLFSWLDKRANTAHHCIWCALEKLQTLFAVPVVLGNKSVVKWHAVMGPRTHSYYCHNASATIYWFLRELPYFAQVCDGHFSFFPSFHSLDWR